MHMSRATFIDLIYKDDLFSHVIYSCEEEVQHVKLY